MKQFFINLFLKIMASKAIYIPLLTGAVVATSGGVVAGVVHYQHTHEVVSAETDTEETTTTRDFQLKETTTAEVTTTVAEEPIELIPIEELEIVEDNSAEPTHEDVPVVESTGISSSGVYEVSQLVYGIDVSKWQGDIDWTRVANSGISFAMIKCGGNEGGLYEDVKFRQNIQGALANGIQVGVYFYSTATDAQTALKEASLCLDLIKDYQITYPVAIDWEDSGPYNGVTEAITTFCDIVASHGYQPMVYSNKNRWYNAFDGATLSSKYKTWMACYFNSYYYTSQRWKYGDDLPDFRYNYDMWQYGVTNTVDGINGWCDMNIAFFGYANYKVQGLQEPKVTIANPNNIRYLGSHSGQLDSNFDFWTGVNGTNSIGYNVTDMDCQVFNSSGQVVSWMNVYYFPDVYTIKYSFKDPKSGIVSASSKLEVISVTETFSGSDITISRDAEGKIPAGTDLTAGVSCTSSIGDTVYPIDYSMIKTSRIDGSQSVIAQNNIAAEILDSSNYTYKIRYVFDVPKDASNITYDVNLNII